MARWWTAGVRRSDDIPQWWALLAFGAVFVASVANLVIGLRFVSTAQHAGGTIVEVVEVEEFDGLEHAPVVQFTTADGTPVRFQSDQTTGERSHYQVGQQVGVLYAAENPHRARIDTWQSRWGQDAILPALCLLIISSVPIKRILERRARRRNRPAADAPAAIRCSARQSRAT